jgi:hypothetical protein
MAANWPTTSHASINQLLPRGTSGACAFIKKLLPRGCVCAAIQKLLPRGEVAHAHLSNSSCHCHVAHAHCAAIKQLLPRGTIGACAFIRQLLPRGVCAAIQELCHVALVAHANLSNSSYRVAAYAHLHSCARAPATC